VCIPPPVAVSCAPGLRCPPPQWHCPLVGLLFALFLPKPEGQTAHTAQRSTIPQLQYTRKHTHTHSHLRSFLPSAALAVIQTP
jgi:hypothetical protein